MSEQRTNLTVASSVKEYALACSKANRAGKFKRVSQEFLDDIEAEVDCILRQIESKVREPLHAPPPGLGLADSLRCITGFAAEAAHKRLEAAIRKIILNKVQSTPSCGQTL
jgi:hypothetical protein